ncbi:hypothetical protein NPIL_318551 [Nephila pilipes]|uniref:Uncharacterized protein n=1 Tax=Nephila pilipes TaxID=299642 RepID=A0A8X6UA04_NEPPI|nr:hypothetical protein NPIL_318551 [Nephila pilipes]
MLMRRRWLWRRISGRFQILISNFLLQLWLKCHFDRECRESEKTCYTCGKAGQASAENVTKMTEENVTNVISLGTLLVIVLQEEMAVEEDIGEIPDPDLKFPITTVAEVSTLIENVVSLKRLATLVERLVTSAENATKMTEV